MQQGALIIGTGGIGTALAAALEADARYSGVVAVGRSTGLDVLDEAQLAALSASLDPAPALVIVTTGMLHDDRQQPEKSLRDLDLGNLARSFAINAIAPGLIAKHILPVMPSRERIVFAVLGARVGSIGDNRTGGWHGYRASKAALVQLIRTIAIETARTRPQAIVVALHPGTVDTGMSKPFQRGVTPEKLFTPDVSAAHLLTVIDRLTPADTGGHFAWDGARIPA
jgi:NAD(P)-dependent dehydrogenase (short-subunit alcohol dehydrogenase family)